MKKLLMDMSSVLWMSLLAGRDAEFGRSLAWPDDPEKKPAYINSAAFGFENFVNHLVSMLKRFDMAPRDVVMVFEGKNSKALRKYVADYYKAGRDHHPAAYEEFTKLADQARACLLGLGALAVHQDGLEADDVLGYLAQNLRCPHVVDSNDGDLLVLMGEHTSVFRDGELNKNKYGPFDSKYITLYKALVGDDSDKIKGAFRFGKMSFFELFAAFGVEGLDAMIGLIQARKLEDLHEDVAELKELQRIIDSKDLVYTSWDLARLYPEKVNTARSPLQIQAGKVVDWDSTKYDQRLKQWYGARRIVHAGNYAEACQFALGKILDSEFVALDIETSTPPESDEWLEQKKRVVGKDEAGDLGVDQLASKLTALSLTFGNNMQFTLYFAVDHTEEDGFKNVTSDDVRRFVELVPDSKEIVVHGSAFELSVLWQAWGEEWKNNGFHGFLPNIRDTVIEKSYVDENTKRGLKFCSKAILGYDQVDYATVTQGWKMNQLTALAAFDYGCDDTVCTAALRNYFRFVMELENTWHIYLAVEINSAYLNALRFVQGTAISMERLLEMERDDVAAKEVAWTELRAWLIANGWAGTVCPEFGAESDFTAKRIKEVFKLVTGRELETQVRTPEKLFALMDDTLLATMLLDSYLYNGGSGTGPYVALNDYIKLHFKGEPTLNLDSNPQMVRLMYEVLALPVRLRNPMTETMRKEGRTEGNPRADDLAFQFALTYDVADTSEAAKVLRAIQTMRIVGTRQKLFYRPYRFVRHWRDQLVHAQVLQCQAVTRRPASRDPNLFQLPKHEKHGQIPKFREVYIPHHKDAVVVSVDFKGQEMVVIADESQDPNLLACFVGEHKKDVHSLTGVGIVRKRQAQALWRMVNDGEPEAAVLAECIARWKGYTYEQFVAAFKDPQHPDHRLLHAVRPLAKKTNFTTEYGAQSLKLSETLIIPKEEAQLYIDAKYETFARSEAWKKELIDQAHRDGHMTTMLGARRHLPDLMSQNKYDVSAAERQAVNFRVQGSCAEMTKLAEGRLWKAGTYFKFDARFVGSIYDEVVSSCAVRDLIPFLREKHALMTVNYAAMTVPIVGSVSFGRDFKNQIECGDDFDEGAVHEALRQIGFELQREAA